MRVVECSAVRSGFKTVCETPTGWDRAHRDTWDAVCPFRVLLVDAMPVHGGTFGGPRNGIVYGDLNGVSPVGFNQRLRIE